MNKFYTVISILGFVLLASCAKPRVSEGLMDDPQTHSMQGKKYWDKGEYQKAAEEFELALSLDKKYGPAHAGMAMVKAATGDFKKAESYADDAIGYCKKDKDPAGLIAMGVVLTLKNKGSKEEDWYEKPEKFFKKAIEMAPKKGEAWYRLGQMYKIAYQFRKSEDSFRANLDLKDEYQDESNREWELVQKIVRAAPGTRVGQKVALVDQITRADIAALFVNELELDRIMEKRKAKAYDTDFKAPDDPREMQTETTTKVADILDLEGHWAKNFILDLQKFRIRGLEPTPDHKFNPNEPILRSQYAFFIEDILIAITGDATLATKHIGATESRFPDVNASSPYYNAICNAVDKNIMNAELSGEFGAMKTVSGPDALLIIRSIKEMRR
jgi:tetratricopeptide (TPR) repeat protein